MKEAMKQALEALEDAKTHGLVYVNEIVDLRQAIADENEAFDEIEKAQQRRVAHGVTDGSLWRKRQEPDPILAMARHAGFTVENGKITDGTDSGVDISDELRAFARLLSTKE